MNRRSDESIGVKVLKVLAAVALVLVALAFGALGACGAWFSGSSILTSIARRGTGYEGGMILLGAIFALLGLGLAGLLIWGVVLLFKRKPDD